MSPPLELNDSITLSVAVALDETPRRLSEIARRVTADLGRPVNPGTVLQALRKGLANGTAMHTAHNRWREPDDALSEHNFVAQCPPPSAYLPIPA